MTHSGLIQNQRMIFYNDSINNHKSKHIDSIP